MKEVPHKQEVVTYQRTFHGIFDLSQALRVKTEQEILLLESADVITKLSEKSLLFFDLALRVEARENKVVVTLLIEEAKGLLKRLIDYFKDEVVEEKNDSATFFFKPLHDHLDLIEKMKARSALNVLRMITSLLHVPSEDLKKSFMLAGAFTYDFLDHFEKLPAPKKDVQDLPDYIFYLPLSVVILDNIAQQTTVYAHSLAGNDQTENTKMRFDNAIDLIEKGLSGATRGHAVTPRVDQSPMTFTSDIADNDFMKLVERCKEHIYAGDVYQIVPSRTFFHPIKDVVLGYQTLKRLNPSPYMFFLRTRAWTLFGASPETFIKIDNGGKNMSIRPIAGTRRRGFDQDGNIDPELDSREQASLCLDEKELAEHMMLVDLARNDIASVSRPRSRRIKRLLGVDRFSHVMHLVSEVEGRLNSDHDAFSAYQASMNMGTLMGAPKVRAAVLLRSLEASKRGFYGGAIGYIDLAGDMDTAIVIRSALVKDEMAFVRAGCGVVLDSLPSFEMQETKNKAEAVLRAIVAAGGGS